MSKLNQKEATFRAVTSVIGEFEGAASPTREQRAQINQILFEGFRSGSVELDRQFSDSELKAYVSGLQSNWLRKDSRLNGGVKYTPKNPGSRAGAGDAQIKAMKALLSVVVDPSDKAEIEAAISARQAELKPAKTVTINMEALPEHLKHLVK